MYSSSGRTRGKKSRNWQDAIRSSFPLLHMSVSPAVISACSAHIRCVDDKQPNGRHQYL
jgi:hypothetical protein